MKTLKEFLIEREIKGTKQEKVQDKNFVYYGISEQVTVQGLQDLLDKNIDIDSIMNDRTLLFYIINCDVCFPIIEFLLANGANPNFKDEFGVSILHRLVIQKDMNIVDKIRRVKLLISFGVNLNIKDKKGNTDLDDLIEYGASEVLIQKLKELGFK